VYNPYDVNTTNITKLANNILPESKTIPAYTNPVSNDATIYIKALAYILYIPIIITNS
jgi:hypothetical protein